MKKIIMMFTAVAAALFFSGCNSVVSVAPSTTPITSHDTYTKLGPTIGRSTTVVIAGIFPMGPSNPSRSARDSAIKFKDANALIEVTEDYNVLNLLVVQFFWTTVEGTAIKYERKGAQME